MTTLLIVDDDETIRSAFVLWFTDLGYHVVEAANGTQALALLTTAKNPWIVLLDRMMPRMSGDFVLLKLAQLPSPRPRHQIAVFTAAGPPASGMVLEAMRTLDAVYCSKDCDFDAITALVDRLAQRLPLMPHDQESDEHAIG